MHGRGSDTFHCLDFANPWAQNSVKFKDIFSNAIFPILNLEFWPIFPPFNPSEPGVTLDGVCNVNFCLLSSSAILFIGS